MNENEIAAIRKRLLEYPGETPEHVEQLLLLYEEREDLKRDLVATRGFSNRLAETFLDKKGYPRPPGWHSVFFCPGGSLPRNGVLAIAILVFLVIGVFGT